MSSPPADDSTYPCPVCGKTDTKLFAKAWDSEYRTSDRIYDYYACTHCRAVFLPNPPIDQLHVIYPPNYYSYDAASNSKGILQRVKQWLDGLLFRKILRGMPGERLRILDVGGGVGWMAGMIREQEPRISATHVLDMDANAGAGATAAGHVFHCCRAEEFSSDETFDFMILLNIIEHVADPRKVLNNLRKSIAPTGRLLLKTPNIDCLDCRLLRNMNWGVFHCPRHWVLFDRENLTWLARQAGWKVEWVSYVQGGTPLASTLLSWLAQRGWITITPERPMLEHWLFWPATAALTAMDMIRAPFMKTSQILMLLAPDITQ